MVRIQSSDIQLTSERQFERNLVRNQTQENVSASTSQFASEKDVTWQQSLEVKSSSNITKSDSSQIYFEQEQLVNEIANHSLTDDFEVTSFLTGDARMSIGFMLNVANEASLETDEAKAQVQINSHNTLTEKEFTQVSTQGQVVLENGDTIDFMMELSMEKNFESEQTSQYSGQKKWLDPLVINFTEGVPEFSNQAFEFDLNSDGKTDSLKQTAKGTGFIVFDKNQNNQIDDGSEMFGTQSGDGFADLALYDDDQNGWIDENDDIFSSLKIMSFENDQTQLNNLKDKNVGAIYLGSTESKFMLTDETNDAYGLIKSTGLALSEDGKALTVQTMDFAISDNRLTNSSLTVNGVDLLDIQGFEIPDISLVANTALSALEAVEITSVQFNDPNWAQRPIIAAPANPVEPVVLEANEVPSDAFSITSQEGPKSNDYYKSEQSEKVDYKSLIAHFDFSKFTPKLAKETSEPVNEQMVFEVKLDTNRFLADHWQQYRTGLDDQKQDKLLQMVEMLKQSLTINQENQKKLNIYQ